MTCSVAPPMQKSTVVTDDSRAGTTGDDSIREILEKIESKHQYVSIKISMIYALLMEALI